MKPIGLLAVVLLQACARGDPSDINIIRIENDCRHGNPPSEQSVISMLQNIPRNSFDQVSSEHVNQLLNLYGGVRVQFQKTQVKIPGAAGKLSRTDYLPVPSAIFVQMPSMAPLVYFKTWRPKDGPYRASFTSGTVSALCAVD